MTNEEFTYWIKGYVTLASEDYIDARQAAIINNHANLVREITGKLDPGIVAFLSALDRHVKQNHQIPIADFKKYTARWF